MAHLVCFLSYFLDYCFQQLRSNLISKLLGKGILSCGNKQVNFLKDFVFESIGGRRVDLRLTVPCVKGPWVPKAHCLSRTKTELLLHLPQETVV